MLCLFSGLTVGGWNALDIVSTELFPTAVRSSAFGLLTAIARIGAILGILVTSLSFVIFFSHCSLSVLFLSLALTLSRF